MMGVSEYFAAWLNQLRSRSCVQSPYMRRMVIFPYFDSSERIAEMYFALMLSASIRSAILISFSSVSIKFFQVLFSLLWMCRHDLRYNSPC